MLEVVRVILSIPGGKVAKEEELWQRSVRKHLS